MGPSCDREAILDWVWGTAGLLCTAFSLLTNNKRAITGCHVTAPPPPSSQTLHVALGWLRWQEQSHMPAPVHP